MTFFYPCSVGAGEKKKSSLLVGVAKANFFCFAIEKKSPPENNERKLEFILVFDERVDCSKKISAPHPTISRT
jgi:hypothetical protein